MGRENVIKALSIQQPWAWAIVYAFKDVENRTWRTTYRGEFWIHAGQGFDWDGLHWMQEHQDQLLVGPGTTVRIPTKAQEYKRGGIVGRARITGCVSEHGSPWFVGPWGLLLRDALPVPFLPCKGRLGFFEPKT